MLPLLFELFSVGFEDPKCLEVFSLISQVLIHKFFVGSVEMLETLEICLPSWLVFKSLLILVM